MAMPGNKQAEFDDRSSPASSLAEWLRTKIGAHGPMPVNSFMAHCLTHPRFGYYRKARAIGANADFVTAPEVSQVFGELIGIWCAAAWDTMGRPDAIRIVELGPGRGTLMADALRALKVVPELLRRLKVHLIDINETLIAEQRRRLRDADGEIIWSDAVPPFEGATILIANEYLDTVAIRQLVFSNGSWRERCVSLDDENRLAFVPGPRVSRELQALGALAKPVDGDILELRSWTAAIGDTLQSLAKQGPFAALFIDYGYGGPAIGDTFQAVRGHAHDHPLAHPGEADLTAHVDFATFAKTMADLGFAVDGPISQAQFLTGLGIGPRATRLMQSASTRQVNEIEVGIQRLMAPQGMGGRFKAIAVRSSDIGPLAPF